jgi:hypothetical protein
MILFGRIDPSLVPTPPVGKATMFVGLDGTWRAKLDNGSIVVYQSGISPEEVQQIVAAFFQDSLTINVTHDDNNNILTAEVVESEVDHNSLKNLAIGDPHAQYLTQSRGDIRYYTKTELNNGQLDSRYYTEAETNALLNAKINLTAIGAANGVAGLDASQKILLINIPAGINHLNLDNIGSNTHAQIDSHIANTSNPHGVTKAQVGLVNCDNTSDANKPISIATQNALDNKSSIGHGHAGATTSTSGFMSGADKTKLDGIISDVILSVSTALTNTSNTTFVTINQLAIPVIAGNRYKFKAEILFDSAAAATGLALSMGGSATGTIRAVAEIPISNTAGTANKFSGPISALNGVVTGSGVGTAGTQYLAEIEGVFTATTSGLIYPQFRSEVNGSQVRVNIDSNMVYKGY